MANEIDSDVEGPEFANSKGSVEGPDADLEEEINMHAEGQTAKPEVDAPEMETKEPPDTPVNKAAAKEPKLDAEPPRETRVDAIEMPKEYAQQPPDTSANRTAVVGPNVDIAARRA